MNEPMNLCAAQQTTIDRTDERRDGTLRFVVRFEKRRKFTVSSFPTIDE